ncbi:hypothetical protein F5B22DRAFT_622292 [Xylaria bambusicola]|uniref:uncharacterized protein n=1 Tax=Xylaria bambusicola TaxID=326684 RepID=UPI0020085B6E|nr:uncharacterized protein F5B22DRAFT_622292 [Xylaria bambusicola]KAI0506855.1 hypothetical protein F5B22DRAFT_622292 [Xylaria bambusicola]
MKYSTAISAGLALVGFASAAPTSVEARAVKSAAQIIGEIAPNSLTCADTSATSECRTNVQAAPLFIHAFKEYRLFDYGQMAAVLALTSLESVDFQYKHNVKPGRPGQGTSNMQMITFNQEYAASIDALKDPLAAIGTADTPEKQNAVLALVKDDKYNFASGPWFLTKHCPASVDALKARGTQLDDAFKGYMDCVGVTIDAARQEKWTLAKKAFGL